MLKLQEKLVCLIAIEYFLPNCSLDRYNVVLTNLLKNIRSFFCKIFAQALEKVENFFQILDFLQIVLLDTLIVDLTTLPKKLRSVSSKSLLNFPGERHVLFQPLFSFNTMFWASRKKF